MSMSQRASIGRQSTAHSAAELELQLKWSNKYCLNDHIVKEKVFDKGLLLVNIKQILRFVLKFRCNLGDFCSASIKTPCCNNGSWAAVRLVVVAWPGGPWQRAWTQLPLEPW